MIKDLWNKLTAEEQQELGQYLEKAFQEEIDREVIKEIKKTADVKNTDADVIDDAYYEGRAARDNMNSSGDKNYED